MIKYIKIWGNHTQEKEVLFERNIFFLTKKKKGRRTNDNSYLNLELLNKHMYDNKNKGRIKEAVN